MGSGSSFMGGHLIVIMGRDMPMCYIDPLPCTDRCQDNFCVKCSLINNSQTSKQILLLNELLRSGQYTSLSLPPASCTILPANSDLVLTFALSHFINSMHCVQYSASKREFSDNFWYPVLVVMQTTSQTESHALRRPTCSIR